MDFMPQPLWQRSTSSAHLSGHFLPCIFPRTARVSSSLVVYAFVVRPLHNWVPSRRVLCVAFEGVSRGSGLLPEAGPVQIDPRTQRKVCGVRGWVARQLIFGCTDGALNRK